MAQVREGCKVSRHASGSARRWIVATVLGISLATDVALGVMVWANVTMIDAMSADLERVTAAIGPLVARHDRASQSADELRVQLRDCQVKHITELLRAQRYLPTTRRRPPAEAPFAGPHHRGYTSVVVHRSGVLLTVLGLIATGVAAAAEPRVTVVVGRLEVPWALAFAPDGRLFVTERPGRIRVVKDGRVDPTPVATLPVAAHGEGGLMGLALDPAFAQTGRLYACYTAEKRGRTINRVVTLVARGGAATEERVLLDDVPGAGIHDGCRVKFGPDGKLYVTTGDAGQSQLAQRRDSLAGKILRLNPDGSVPADNPFSGSLICSLGHRNPQGLAWDRAGRLYAAEHGPSGIPWGHDELNLILPGRNYGWPEVYGRAGDPRFVDPILESGSDTWAPSGIAILGDDLYMAALRGRRLLRVRLTTEGTVAGVASLLERAYGRLRDVVLGPDGALYVTTSNRDGRGSPAADDDRILRLDP